MKSYECKIFMGSVRYGSEGTRFFEHDVVEQIKYFQSQHLNTKVTVRITQTRFIFLHYEEPGFELAAIKYPRFPISDFEIKAWMILLGKYLKCYFDQKSLSIMDNDSITFLGEPDDNPVT